MYKQFIAIQNSSFYSLILQWYSDIVSYHIILMYFLNYEVVELLFFS